MNDRNRFQDALIYAALSISFVALLSACPRNANQRTCSITAGDASMVIPRSSPVCPRDTVQFHLNLPAAESGETSSTIHFFKKMNSATPTDETDESRGGEGISSDVMGTALSLLVDNIIRRAFDEGLAKRAEESSKRQQDPSLTTATILNPTSGPGQTAEKQEVKRWLELLELEDEVKQMAERVAERERAIGERERRVTEQEDAMRMSSNGDGLNGIEDKKRAGSWMWW